MRASIDLAWAAGFLEGEGSFGHYGSPRVSAAQNQREPLDRLCALFGGVLFLKQPTGFSKQPIWTWRPSSHRSVEIMMTLYVLMSPKRQEQIAAALAIWKRSRLMKRRGTEACARGHALAGDNLKLVNGYEKCRACQNANKRAHRAAQRMIA